MPVLRNHIVRLLFVVSVFLCGANHTWFDFPVFPAPANSPVAAVGTSYAPLEGDIQAVASHSQTVRLSPSRLIRTTAATAVPAGDAFASVSFIRFRTDNMPDRHPHGPAAQLLRRHCAYRL